MWTYGLVQNLSQALQGYNENTNFLEKLHLNIGSRIMIIYSISIPEGLENRQMGTVIGFEFFKIHKIKWKLW